MAMNFRAASTAKVAATATFFSGAKEAATVLAAPTFVSSNIVFLMSNTPKRTTKNIHQNSILDLAESETVSKLK